MTASTHITDGEFVRSRIDGTHLGLGEVTLCGLVDVLIEAWIDTTVYPSFVSCPECIDLIMMIEHVAPRLDVSIDLQHMREET